MADKSLADWVAPIYGTEDTEALIPGQDSATKIRRVGMVLAPMSVARFLDIENKGLAFTYWKQSVASEKTLTLADGTKLESSKSGTSAEFVKIAQKIYPANSISVKGSRTISLETGNKIENTRRKRNKDNAFHQISFRFPAWVNIFAISDWLGSMIPSAKFSLTPSANQVKPFFKVKGGRRYAVMSESQATEDTDTRLILTPSELAAIQTQIDAKKSALILAP